MLYEIMHRHRRFIVVAIFLFVGLPLALFVPGVGGGNQQQGGMDFPVAQVGDVPVTAEQFLRQYSEIFNARQRTNDAVTASDLVIDGTVENILDGLVADALLTQRTAGINIQPEREYLVGRLKEYALFRNEQGNFDATYYNQWIESNSRRGISWDAIYEDVSRQVVRANFVELMSASARVLGSEVRREFEELNTKVRVRHASITPPVDLSEEDYLQHFEDNKSTYNTLEERVAEFIAISLEAPRPAIVDEVVTRARGGESFEALAQEYSQGPNKESGGDMGWVVETEDVPEHQKALFALEMGGVSDPVKRLTGLHVYKAEEERTNEETGQREVRARQIVFYPSLESLERQRRIGKAEQLLVKVREFGDLEFAAEDEGFAVQVSGQFSGDSSSFDNVPLIDSYDFRRALSVVEPDTISDLITAQENLYIARVIEVIPPRPKTYEEAREQVERDALDLYKNGPDYVNRVIEINKKIEADGTSLDDIATFFPDLDVEIKETKAFGPQDFLFEDGIFWSCREAVALLDRKAPGELAGPIRDFQRVDAWLELIERTLPDASAWEEDWPQQEELLHDRAMQYASVERQQDYLQHLTEQAASEAMIQKDYQSIYTLLGLDDFRQFGGLLPSDRPTDTEDPTPVPQTESTEILEVPETVIESQGEDESAAEPESTP